MNFLQYFQPSSVIWQAGPISIKYYGVIMTIAIIACLFVVWKLLRAKNRPTDDIFDLAFWVVLFGLIGARLYDVILIDGSYYFLRPLEVIYVWQGGLAIHGAIIGGLLAVIFWCRRKGQDFWQWAAMIAVALPLGQAIGRWGNYFNSELFGGPTNLPWGIPIAEYLRPAVYASNQYFHPAFLYESILDLILFAALFIIYQKQRLKPKQIVGVYLVGYGIIRFAMEFIRIDLTAIWLGLRAPQIVSLILAAAGIWLIVETEKNKTLSR